MKLAYADPPYLGVCKRYEHHHPDGLCWDEPDTHRALVARLVSEFPDGWALSASAPSLQAILPMCPMDVRVAPWVKPFAAWKPNVSPAYAWEPVIFRGGRRLPDAVKVADYLSANIQLQAGLVGAKPERFAWWVLNLLGASPEDELVDLFPGTGGVGRAWAKFRAQLPLDLVG